MKGMTYPLPILTAYRIEYIHSGSLWEKGTVHYTAYRGWDSRAGRV